MEDTNIIDSLENKSEQEEYDSERKISDERRLKKEIIQTFKTARIQLKLDVEATAMEEMLNRKISALTFQALEQVLPYYTLKHIFNTYQLLYLFKNVPTDSVLFSEIQKLIENAEVSFEELKAIFNEFTSSIKDKDDLRIIDILLEKLKILAISTEEKADTLICELKRRKSLIAHGYMRESEGLTPLSTVKDMNLIIKACEISTGDKEIEDLILNEILLHLKNKKGPRINIVESLSPLSNDQLYYFLQNPILDDSQKEDIVQILMQRDLSMDQWDEIINKTSFNDASIKTRILDRLIDPSANYNKLKNQYVVLSNSQEDYEKKQQLLTDMLYIAVTFEQTSFVALNAYGKTYQGAVRKISGFRDVPLDKLISTCINATDDQGDLLRKALITMMAKTNTPLSKWDEIREKFGKNHIMHKVAAAMCKRLEDEQTAKESQEVS